MHEELSFQKTSEQSLIHDNRSLLNQALINLIGKLQMFKIKQAVQIWSILGQNLKFYQHEKEKNK